MSYFSKLMELDKFKDQNYAKQAWFSTNKNSKSNLYTHRLVSELSYAYEVSKINNHEFKDLIEETSKFIYMEYLKNLTITKDITLKAEELLQPIQKKAKSFEILFASHAHIDMNWLWPYNETVSVTLDTFDTMIKLLEEYPDFIFSQSQASVYDIVKKYNPVMFEKIKQFVAQNRWEITASTWVEGDKNMANLESQIRQLNYAKSFFKKHFNKNSNDILIDYEPDTFGHHKNLASVLNYAHTKFLYHCRGNEEEVFYRYASSNGDEIIAFRDPKLYTMGINGHIAKKIPALLNQYNLNKYLAVYGVSDHGGGPTRKDLDLILMMKEWPIYPKIKFSTYTEFYKYLEENKDILPLRTQELNFVFSGCYSSISEIKKANKYGENSLFDTENINALLADKINYPYNHEAFKEAWLNILFSQFHDILPGSGVEHTLHYALGHYQDTMAYSLSTQKNILNSFFDKVDTSKFDNDTDYFSTSLGSGVGYDSGNFRISKSSRGYGKTRIYHIYNPLSIERTENVFITLWNYEGDEDKVMFIDSKNNILDFDLYPNKEAFFIGGYKEGKRDNYWGHYFNTYTVNITIPANGYETIILKEDPNKENYFHNILTDNDDIPRVQGELNLVLENNFIKATFDPHSLKLVSFIDKETNSEFIKNPSGFRMILEDTAKGMDSWVIGRYSKFIELDDILDVTITNEKTYSQITYKLQYETTTFLVKIFLNNFSKHIEYDLEVSWKLIGENRKQIPQFNYNLELNDTINDYFYDIPLEIIKRKPLNIDVPGLTFGSAYINNKYFSIISDSKYGFRGYNNNLSMTLLRASTEPGAYSEVGDHNFKFIVGFNNNLDELYKTSLKHNHEVITVMGSIHEGSYPLSNSFINLEATNVYISSIKLDEFDNNLIIRLYSMSSISEEVIINTLENYKEVKVLDALENEIDTNITFKLTNNQIKFIMPSHSIITLKVK